jgi:hypothetical protein
LQAATNLLHKVAARQPLVLVLEDLHDADQGTLDLLLYLARNLDGARLLVVGTYRDVEIDRAHPLSAALAELHRTGNVARLHLRGLSTLEVLRLLSETSHSSPRDTRTHRSCLGIPMSVGTSNSKVPAAKYFNSAQNDLKRGLGAIIQKLDSPSEFIVDLVDDNYRSKRPSARLFSTRVRGTRLDPGARRQPIPPGIATSHR